jgi:tetratricopeptide (TPR) repeat protein
MPDGGNKKASVSERIGITDVTINYDRPAVKGREGKIWGQLVPYGFNDLGFGTSKAAPWRAGANENTTMSFSTDVMIEGKPLAAGTYAFFIDMEQGNANLIFSKNSTSWGSFFYDPKEDALRVNVKTVPLAESVERLKYEFMDEKENSATVALLWEKLKVPFTVQVDYVKTQMESFRRELRSNKGFEPDAYDQAANFILQNNGDLNEALTYSDYAINGVFVGQKNFRTLSTKASVLTKMNRQAEADALMKEAMPMANMQELHQYGRTLLRQKRNAEALEAFKLNAQKYPNVFTTSMGLMRAYSANGDYKNALKYAKVAQAQATDPASKTQVEGYIKMLEAGKDIN